MSSLVVISYKSPSMAYVSFKVIAEISRNYFGNWAAPRIELCSALCTGNMSNHLGVSFLCVFHNVYLVTVDFATYFRLRAFLHTYFLSHQYIVSFSSTHYRARIYFVTTLFQCPISLSRSTSHCTSSLLSSSHLSASHHSAKFFCSTSLYSLDVFSVSERRLHVLFRLKWHVKPHLAQKENCAWLGSTLISCIGYVTYS